jgi:hypothetical protein
MEDWKNGRVGVSGHPLHVARIKRWSWESVFHPRATSGKFFSEPWLRAEVYFTARLRGTAALQVTNDIEALVTTCEAPRVQTVSSENRLARISHVPVRNAHKVPTSVGANRESFRPGRRFPSGLRRVDFSQIQKFVRSPG